MYTKEQILQKCTVDGNIVKLPNMQLERKLYIEVAKSLQLIGGKWKSKPVFGFVFKDDPTNLLEQISQTKGNLKKDFQFFATPEHLADRMVYLADIKNHDKVLEPSAGQGAIIKSINKVSDILPECLELMEINREVLEQERTQGMRFVLIGKDFLNEDVGEYNKIIANPPFSKCQDLEHIMKMYECLARGGRLVTLCSGSWEGKTKKKTKFREWLDTIDVEIEDIPSGTFKESGTNVGAKLLIINKPPLFEN